MRTRARGGSRIGVYVARVSPSDLPPPAACPEQRNRPWRSVCAVPNSAARTFCTLVPTRPKQHARHRRERGHVCSSVVTPLRVRSRSYMLVPVVFACGGFGAPEQAASSYLVHPASFPRPPL